MTSFLAKNGTQILLQPPYFPDIAPNDFFLFPKLKAVLKGRHFDTRDDIIEKSPLALKSIPKQAYKNCFDNWEKRWRWCVEARGDYFEKELLQTVDHLLFSCPAFLRHRIQTAILLGLTHLNTTFMVNLPDSTSAWNFLVKCYNSAIKTGLATSESWTITSSLEKKKIDTSRCIVGKECFVYLGQRHRYCHNCRKMTDFCTTELFEIFRSHIVTQENGVRTILTGKMSGRHIPGHPLTCFVDQLKELTGLTVTEMVHRAQDRDGWRHSPYKVQYQEKSSTGNQ
ncbi:hypothetical protein LAZ67_11002877 [Cordylochernes scorpioides]|uniref:Transposase n=1 Tax=Cordylochernes scorpioides TaxID=51811 RepID=A0ABY6KZH7_9ARAC|nr:hypothetical protein LAZ67_11002877 [Cordylochernes scorpioides]